MKKILFCFIVLISGGIFGQQKFQNLKGSKPMKVEYMGKSPKLTAIKPIPNRTKATVSDVYVVPNKLTKTGLLKQGPNSAPDPVMQKTTLQTFATGSAGQVLQGFDGGSNEDNAAVNGIRVTPPDTQGDVGLNHYIQMTNSVTTIFDKSGNTLFGPVPNSVFFQNLDPRLAGTNDGDPIVLYDQFADRWIISQFAVSEGAPYAMLIAVSATPDPLGEYNQYAINYDDDFPDYPKLGIWNDALYISTRDFGDDGGFGFSIVAINRADIIAGVETEAQRFQIDNLGFDGILPADADSTLPPPEGEPHYSLFMGGTNELNLITTSIDFENPANSTLEFGTVPVAPFSFFDTAVPQPNGQSLDALPFFLMYRLQYMNFGTHASLLANHSVQEVAGGPFGIRWYEFRDTAEAPWEVYQQGTFLPDDGLNRWMGSMAMNENGDIALGYSVSSATLAPSIRFVGQSSSESGTGILNIPETSILEGTFSISGADRWGDYSMMSIDPVDQDFWFTTEYVADEAATFGWATFISEMTFGDPPIAVCQDITVEFDANDGSISITPEQIDNGSIGPDGGAVTLSLDMDTFNCSNIGENIVTLTATSSEGISASCTATVTVNVIDVDAPVAVCQDILVELGLDGSIEITAEQIDGGSTDNCSIASLAVDESVFTELGTFAVTLTVTDFSGLTDSCEAIVTVAKGAEIVIDTPSITAAVDIGTDIPPVATESFLITNNGDVPLDFTTEIGVTEIVSEEMISALANLDRSIYSNSNKQFSIESFKSVEALRKEPELKIAKPELANSSTVIDSLFYDTGIDFPTSFGGLGDGTALSTGVLFVVDSEEFTLTSVRNAYSTELVVGANILLQVYAGGVTPDQGELLFEQIITGDSETGVFALETLSSPLTFTQGESFWVVHSYPEGIDFPQGQDAAVTNTVPGVYCFSSDGGQTFTLIDGFAFLTRALNEGLDGGSFITLSPENGVVQSGESLEVNVSFNGETLANGTYDSDLTINSNDPLTPAVTIPTSFTVSGQTSTIEVSDELLLFNDVFIGNSAERSLIISNIGVNALTISSITSDNVEFVATPASATIIPGEELEILVSYTPENIGSSNGILTITSDAANAASFEVVVNGVGVEGPFAVLDPLQNLVTLPQGESTDVDITLSNDGGSPLIYAFPEFTMAAAIANGTELYKAEVIDFPSFSAAQSKGFKDTRTGVPVPFSMGTDLEFGYTWIDSDEPGGPVPNFIDIVALGATDITESLIDTEGFADGTAELPLPFPIPFYGEDQESLFINANGFVAFEAPIGTTFINGQIPVDDGVNNIIAPFWTDLEPGIGDGGTVHIAAFTDAIVVQWTDAPGFFTTGSVTFQVVLFLDGTIDVQYEDVSTASFLTNSTVGIENTGATDGAQVAFNTDFVKDNFAVRFMPPAALTDFIANVSSVSGSLEAGEEDIITVTLDASDLVPEVYLDELVFSSNSIDIEESTTVFELTVVEAPESELTFTLINAATDEAIGPLVDGAVIDLADFNANSFSVVAVPNDMSPGSIVFDFNGITGFQTENLAPYALDGDTAGDFNPVEFLVGINTITATPFSDRSGSGEAGIPLTVTFEVISAPVSDITSFTLIDADVDEEIGPLNEGDVIDLANFNNNSFSVAANIGDASVGSVIFDFNGTTGFQTENLAPYALDGDTAGDFNPVEFPVGINTITATPFSGAVGSGSAGTPLTVTFEVVDDIEIVDSPDNFGGYIYPNPVYDVTNFTLEDKSAKVLTGTIQSLSLGINQKFKLVTDNLGNGNIDMSALPKGIYILQLKDENGVLVSQLKIAKN